MNHFQVFLFVIIFKSWDVKAQFGRVSLSLGMGDMRSDDNKLDIGGSCPANTTCMPISSCPMLSDLLDFSCFASDNEGSTLFGTNQGFFNVKDKTQRVKRHLKHPFKSEVLQSLNFQEWEKRYFHRLNELSCGSANNEDYVCCPSCDCGKLYQDGTEQCGQSMVRGVDYNGLGAHPWVARIGFTHKDNGNVRFACSGSILAKRIVLTAAHCALAKPEGYKLSTVVVGEWDISRSPDCNDFFCAPPNQAIKVDSVIVHPGYEQKIFRHDVALIVLKDDIKFSVTAAPICLNDKPEVVINERASLVGWGKLSGQSSQVSRQQQLDVPVVTLATCERIFGDSVPIHEGQLCAGGEEGRDACSGFGGAPLLLNRDGKYVQIGIVSFGSENCGSEGVPSVYTKIAHYHRWIVENSPS